MEVLLGGGFFEVSAILVELGWRVVVIAVVAVIVLGSWEIAREGYGEVEHGSSSFFSSNWNGKFGRWSSSPPSMIAWK